MASTNQIIAAAERCDRSFLEKPRNPTNEQLRAALETEGIKVSSKTVRAELVRLLLHQFCHESDDDKASDSDYSQSESDYSSSDDDDDDDYRRKPAKSAASSKTSTKPDPRHILYYIQQCDRETLMAYRTVDLQQAASELGVSKSGVKGDLVNRLTLKCGGKQAASPQVKQGSHWLTALVAYGLSENNSIEDLACKCDCNGLLKKSKDELSAMAKRFGLPYSGTKAKLANVLLRQYGCVGKNCEQV